MRGNKKNRRNMGRFSGSNVRANTGNRSQTTGNRYTRGQVLRGAGVVAAGLGAAAVGLGGGARAQAPPAGATVVNPNMPLNTPYEGSIQEAVDGGGVVFFKAGDYNQFGTHGHIFLGQTENDVHIVGEYDSTVTPAVPTIHGGQSVFRAGGTGEVFGNVALAPFCDTLPAVNISIKGIHFIGSSLISIVVFAAKGLKVSGCTFTEPKLFGSVPHPLGAGIITGRPVPDANFINIYRGYFGKDPIDFNLNTNPDAWYTGTVEITNNVFDGRGTSYDTDPGLSEAVYFERDYTGGRWYTGMSNAIVAFHFGYCDLTISGNGITGTLSVALASNNKYITKILDNNVSASESPAWNNGGIRINPAESTTLSRNTVNASGDGIWGFSNNVIIEKNNITMSPYPFYPSYTIGALNLDGLTNSIIRNNKISGNTHYGCYVATGSTGNFFNGNNLTGLTLLPEDPYYPLEYPPSFYVFESGACNNTVKGYTGGNNTQVVDEDECNDITGVK